MRLSKLKLAGFKSFVDPTTVLTPGQLVGIVGPNGCGKSNIIDAVRWVLGESRAAALRGDSMQDVIFNGSTTRKPVSRASVELVFDNADGKAAGQWSQYAEIAVKRVVDRSGLSDYFINNVRVRRKDVIDLFLGTGLGPRAYAIIEQGMISRVIEARPEDVRAFLEEAAGITKYKERRRETEGRLADARDNLARIEDIRAELGSQIDKLGTQAEVAQRYKALSENLNDKQALLWIYKREQAAAERDKCQLGIASAGISVERETERLRVLENQVSAARENHTRFSEAVSVAQGDLYAASAEVSRFENELRALRENRQRLSQRIDQINANESQWRERAKSFAEERGRWESLRAATAQRLQQSQSQYQSAQGALPALEHAHSEASKQLEKLRAEQAEAEQQTRVAEARRQASQRSLDALMQRRQRLDQERSQLQPQGFEHISERESAAQDLRRRLDLAQTDLAKRQAEVGLAQEAVRLAQEAERSALRTTTEKRARFDALTALQAKLRDQGDMAAWLRSAGLIDLKPLWQYLRVEPGWELAFEAILRERIAALGPLSADLPHALFASPVPATLVVLRQTDRKPRPVVETRFDGTRLLGKVQCEHANVMSVLEDWLADVFAVDKLEDWSADGALPAHVTLVSRNGAALRAGELVLFAPDAKTHGAIERQREIDSLAEELVECDRQQSQHREAVQDAERGLQIAREAQAAANRAQHDLQQALHAAQLEVVRMQQTRARFDERNAQLVREAEEIDKAENTERRHLSDAGDAIAQQLAKSVQLTEQLDAMRALLAERQAALNAQRDKAQALLREQHEAEFAARECGSKLDDVARNETLTREQIERAEVELAHLTAERDALDEASLNVSLQTALDLRRAREAALTMRRDELETTAQAMRQLDEERLRCERGLDPLREELNALRLAHQAAELAHQQAVERLIEMQAQDRQVPAEILAEVKELSLTREVARLGREIADLGPVNLAALSELSTASERKQYLDAQNEDLMSAIGTLEDAIRRIDRETREQLQGTYNTVNRHFGELFPQLFGGGEAELVLTGDEILDAGVQIVARPPGKKNASIHLLSGGEKALTAIALVFSMFQLNPAPFCMLDEVDAPLDDSNTERYCEMVKRMSAVTQFVFISHSKITMEMARQLVGVTMQEQGVSRVVEVDIDEALKLAQPEPA